MQAPVTLRALGTLCTQETPPEEPQELMHTLGLSLNLIAPDLVHLLEQASDARRRRVVSVVCDLAVGYSGLLDARAERALAALAAGRFGDVLERREMRSLIEELDTVTWVVQEQIRLGKAAPEDFQRALSKVRAAAAISYAFVTDSLQAASEAIFEAHHAIQDLEMLKATVVNALR